LSVGVIHATTAIAEMFNISEKELSTIFISMKQIGFEIRNHRTNRQIPMGSILIPYAFPSLNERSLQRLTSL
jgi:DNA (cytosine-5)-methyltransferase 1